MTRQTHVPHSVLLSLPPLIPTSTHTSIPLQFGLTESLSVSPPSRPVYFLLMSVSSVPRLFVDWSACERVLCSTLTGGVRVCCLLSVDGSVLCVAGELHAAKLLSALLASVYANYSEAAGDEWQQLQQTTDPATTNTAQQSEEAATSTAADTASDGLTNLIVVCDDGVVSVARVGRFLVALQSDAGSAMGQVAHKVSTATQPHHIASHHNHSLTQRTAVDQPTHRTFAHIDCRPFCLLSTSLLRPYWVGLTCFRCALGERCCVCVAAAGECVRVRQSSTVESERARGQSQWPACSATLR